MLLSLNPFARPQSLRRAIVTLALGLGAGLMISGLAGCAPNAANDPVVALRVDGTPVPLSAFQQILALLTASQALQADASATAVGWQAPADRATVASAKDQTVNFFVGTLALKQQLDEQHLSVSQKDIDVAVSALNTQVASVRQQLKATPGNQRLRQLVNAATPDAIHWLSLQQAYTTVFSQKGKIPTVKARGILVKSLSDAQAIEAQLKGGADFATLAKAKSLDTQSAANGGELGTVYVGQFSVVAFDQQVFDTNKNDAYLIVPFQSNYGVFQILSRQVAPLSAVGDSQAAQQYLGSWINNIIVPHVKVERYFDK